MNYSPCGRVPVHPACMRTHIHVHFCFCLSKYGFALHSSCVYGNVFLGGLFLTTTTQLFLFFCFLYVALWQMLSASMCCVRFILLLQGVIQCSKAKNTSTIISND